MSGPADAPRAAAAGVTPRLSVLLPTARAWPEIGEALAAALAQDCAEPFEILVLDGHGAGLAGEPSPPVRWLREPGADVFALRALGLAEARGEIVAISEDHCVLPPDWCRRILAAHRASAAPALVGPVANHPGSARRAVDRANFLLTMGPYAAPLDELPPGRLPIPTNLSLKRAALPAGRPPAGWLEYDLLAALRDRGQIGLAGDVTLAHLQSWRAGEALAVHFASGRAYGGLAAAGAPALAAALGAAAASPLPPDAAGARARRRRPRPDPCRPGLAGRPDSRQRSGAVDRRAGRRRGEPPSAGLMEPR
jgi:hypothetical protein